MKILEPSIESIFNIRTDEQFEGLALDVFRFQASENKVYKEFLECLKINPSDILSIDQIPFLPISFFKSLKVVSKSTHEKIFKSSGTGNQTRSQHFVSSLDIYQQSFTKGFQHFYQSHKNYTILALLPSYLEQGDSSLVHMVSSFIDDNKTNGSQFYLHNHQELNEKIIELEKEEKPFILIGVSYALLDFIEKFSQKMKKGIVMETGGMKGRRKEMTKEELHDELAKGFGCEKIHSEYGMTELLSQAYSKENGDYNCPPWMKVLTRSTTDPFEYTSIGARGLINVIDLANINSCSFIATDDVGLINSDGSFKVLGRFDSSEIRGCNLMIN